MASYELKNRASSANREVNGTDSEDARDNLALARLGKKPVLKVCPQPFNIMLWA